MVGYSQDSLANELERIKQRKRTLAGNNAASPVASRNYRDNAPVYSEFAPKEMDTETTVNPFAKQISQQIGRVSTQDTARSGVESQNRFNFQQLQQAEQELAQAQKNQVKATKETIKQPTPLKYPDVVTPGLNTVVGGNPSTEPGSSYYTNTPKWVDPNAGMTTFTAGGKTWTTNASVAGRFEGFINALVATGYKIKTGGSYSDRDQANGSGNPSLHSYGLAVDINPFAAGNSFNPGNTGVHATNLPKGVSALAAKYGLVWGGDWKNSKDYMHFSVPYKGLM